MLWEASGIPGLCSWHLYPGNAPLHKAGLELAGQWCFQQCHTQEKDLMSSVGQAEVGTPTSHPHCEELGLGSGPKGHLGTG